MDSSYLTTQVATVVNSLHALFDDIGIPHHDREAREAALYAALSETLQSQLRIVTAEKNTLIEEANKLVLSIKQMNRALDDNGRESGNSIMAQSHDLDDSDEANGLAITFPIKQCVEGLKEKYMMVNKLYAQRFEQVKKLAEALNSYAQQMESGFVKIHLPDTSTPSSVFKMPPSYMLALDREFTRVYEEYTKRLATSKSLCSEIVQLWAELGTPSAQTELAIVECCRGTSEEIGIREEDLGRLRAKKDRLHREKKDREDRLAALKAEAQHLWARLGCEESDTRQFMASHRGCSLRTIQEWEQELDRLNEVKKANLHIFVEDARQTLQEMWDNLYFSEEEMLDFTPGFSDVYTDALLEAHEMEIVRLQALLEEWAPILELVEKHQTLVNDRQNLEASAQDSSRLLARGPRDPTRLLREEKMRKRITKELPKVEATLSRMLEEWEEEHGRPFNINGAPYLETLLENQRPAKATALVASTASRQGALSRATSTKSAPASAAKTPSSTLSRASSRNNGTMTRPRTTTKSPTPSTRAPLSNLASGSNSPERRPPGYMGGRRTPTTTGRKTPTGAKTPNGTINKAMPAYMVQTASQAQKMAPPKMRALDMMPPPSLKPYRNTREDRPPSASGNYPATFGRPHEHNSHTPQQEEAEEDSIYQNHPPINQTISRITSGTSTISHNTGASSENWETFGEDSDDEPDARQTYYEKLHAARLGKRSNEQGHYPTGNKKMRGLLPAAALSRSDVFAEDTVQEEEDGWSDEAF